MIKIIAKSMVYVVSVLLLQACGQEAPPVEQKGPTVVDARTVTVQPGSWRRNFKAYGLVRPAEEYEIGVEVSATVKEVLFREGQKVEIGDLLLAKGVEVDRRRIMLGEPIKALGDHAFSVRLHRSVIAEVKLLVVNEQGESAPTARPAPEESSDAYDDDEG